MVLLFSAEVMGGVENTAASEFRLSLGEEKGHLLAYPRAIRH